MRQTLVAILFAGLLGAALAGPPQDDFKREGKRDRKDPLEGKAPPAFQVKEWLNAEGKPVSLEAYKGKVVLLDFWGVW